MEIKVFEKTEGCMPEVLKVGEWHDLKTASDIVIKGPYSKALKKKTKDGEVVERYRDVVFSSVLVPLGVAMQIPEGYEAILAPRSSTFKKWGLLQTNSVGIIDSSYCSEKDEWKMPVVATRAMTIPKGTRLCQFRIQLSQKATMWQKLKWLFTSSVEINKVDSLNNPERGGFGSTDSDK